MFVRRKEGRSWFDKLIMSGQVPLVLSLSKDGPCRITVSMTIAIDGESAAVSDHRAKLCPRRSGGSAEGEMSGEV